MRVWLVFGGGVMAGLLMLCMLIAGTAPAQSQAWARYDNAKYNFSGCYPGNLFTGTGESDAGDGQEFTAPDGAKIYMFGAYVMDDPPLDNLRDEMMFEETNYLGAAGKPVLQRLTPGYFIFSGYAGSQIIFEKKLLSHDEFISLVVTYPKSQRARYDKLIAPMLRCLKAR